ncbi:hypothetical protein LZ31DRAFT_597509 [Colletotrichum somersetense]|nr:hypothetical protein LZ31DRAFT_597509 [Colletotrichum somersetense]
MSIHSDDFESQVKKVADLASQTELVEEEGAEGSRGAKVQCSAPEPQWAGEAAKLRERSLAIQRANAKLCGSVNQFTVQVLQVVVEVRELIFSTKMQTKWAELEALVKKPGVDRSEVSKHTIDIEELLTHSGRSKAIRKQARKVQAANKAMMQDATSIARRGRQLEKDLDDFFEDHRVWRAQFEESGARTPTTSLYAAGCPEIVCLKGEDGR